jgi:hypothetical protein
MKRAPGRPPLDQEAATDRIHVRVTPGQRLEVRRVAAENGTSVSGVIREAVNEYVADYRESNRRLFRLPKRK